MLKKLSLFLTLAMLVFSSLNLAYASLYSWQPQVPTALNNLDHSYYYSWDIDWDIPLGETIIGASLFFDNIRNHNNTSNDLYVHLFDTAPTLAYKLYPSSDVSFSYDWQGGGDNFSGQGILLHQLHNLSSTPQDITYNFDASQISTLIGYFADGDIGLGFDPDCHYYNDGITFKVETEPSSDPVPEPGTMTLMCFGLFGFLCLKKKSGIPDKP